MDKVTRAGGGRDDIRQPEIVEALRATRFFSALGAAWHQKLAPRSQVRRLRAGEMVWRQEEIAEHVTCVVHGLVEIHRAVPNGHGALLGLFGPRESIGLAAALERAPYPADAIAVSTTLDVVRAPADLLVGADEDDPKIARALHRELLEHTRILRAKIDVMSAGSVSARLATLLAHLLDRFGDEGEGGDERVELALSRAQIARLVGARVETVIRILSRWEKEGWLKKLPEGFAVLDPARLRAQET